MKQYKNKILTILQTPNKNILEICLSITHYYSAYSAYTAKLLRETATWLLVFLNSLKNGTQKFLNFRITAPLLSSVITESTLWAM